MKAAALARLEVIISVFWLLSDGAWLMEWRYTNYVASGIAIAASLGAFLCLDRRLVPMLVYFADFCWLLMNSLWAIGDLASPTIGWLIWSAKALFFVSLLFIATALLVCEDGKQVLSVVLLRVKILQLFR